MSWKTVGNDAFASFKGIESEPVVVYKKYFRKLTPAQLKELVDELQKMYARMQPKSFS